MPELNYQEFVLNSQRNVKEHCEICNEQFGIIKREHVCKRCFRSVCHECSPYKVKVYKADLQHRLHRMCRACYLQSEVLQKYIKTNHLKWGEDSDLVNMWLKKLGLKHAPKRRNSQKRKVREYISFQNLWKSLNFSFREFIGLVIDETKTTDKEIEELINIGLTEINHHRITTLQDVAYILIFFLAHSNISNAIYFTITILQITEHQQLDLDNVVYFLETMNCSEIEIYKMQNLIQEEYHKIVSRSTTNYFTAQLSIQILTHLLMKRDFEQLQKGVAYAFSQRKEFICLHYNRPEEVHLDMLRNLSSLEYRKLIKQIDAKSEKSNTKSESNSQIIFDERKYEKLLKQKEELLVKVKYQEEELGKLREERKEMNRDKFEESPPEQFFQSNYEVWNDIKNDPYSTQSGEESYNEIILKKNQEISTLKKQLEEAKDTIKETKEENTNLCDSEVSKLQVKENEMKIKEDEINKIKAQNQALKNMNKRLLLKMHELSGLLMDKEEKQVKSANINFSDVDLEEFSKEQVNKQCIIF